KTGKSGCVRRRKARSCRRSPDKAMTARQALAFVKKHGVVLESARGPVPSLAEAVAGRPIRGGWWAHPKGQEIFALTRAIRDSGAALVCRLVDGKITYVHRRLWPALVRNAGRYPKKHLARVSETHSRSGRHITIEVPYPKWVPRAIRARYL